MTEILLNPGPVNVSARVRAALSRGDACHREPEVAATVRNVRERLVELFAPAGGFEAVLISGSGTAAVEAAVAGGVAAGRTLVVVDNGVYGDRMLRIADAHGIGVRVVRAPWNRWPDLDEIEAAVDADVDAIALVHHETTTGLVNPVAEVGRIARRRGKRFIVDSVSGLGGEPLDVDASAVDLVAGTAGKAIGAFPGMAFVLVRSSALAALRSVPSRSLYLGLVENHDAQLDGCGAFTPAVQLLWAFEEALAELGEETVAARIGRFGRASARLRSGMERLGLAPYLPAELRSNTISAFRLPPGRGFAALHDALKERGFIVYAGQGALAREIFRVANMGHVADADYDRFLAALGAVLA